jgi:single-stranded-DNA-specific exonuclease
MEYQLIAPRIPLKNLTAVERVLTNRGIALAEIEHYLHTTDEDILDPKLISNMREGAEMLIKHIAQNDDILVQVDSDCDGFTSAATLLNYLNCLFPGFVQQHMYYRIHSGKQHGIIPSTIPENIKMVIAPDSSSNDYDEHAELAAKGNDVLVIDHHEADQISTNACIINNQLCDYPTKSLSGVGMVYKFCSYIDELINVDYANLFLDLVALGMIADMMDLRDFETKHLVMLGLKQIRNPYFRGMVDKQAYQLSDGLTPFGIAFYIAPYVNATIRVGTQEEKLMLFESMLDYRGYEQVPSTKRGCKGQVETRVEQACRNCTNIKNRQTKARDASLSTIEHIIEEKGLLENKILVVKLDSEYATDKNLTGLIANQLMAKYQRPVLLLNKVTTIDDVTNEAVISWEGSGRGYDKSKFDNLREFLNQSGLTMYAEGHANALGVGISDRDFIDFIEYSNEALKNFDFTPSYKVDYIFHNDDMNINDILALANLKSVWGQGVEEPLVAIERVKVYKDNVRLMSADKNPTLKITLPNGMSLIKFRSSKEEFDSFDSNLGCVTINIVGRCERNIWNGIVSPQIIIEDYEIVGKTEYYF